jgi:hypothetical protein
MLGSWSTPPVCRTATGRAAAELRHHAARHDGRSLMIAVGRVMAADDGQVDIMIFLRNPIFG